MDRHVSFHVDITVVRDSTATLVLGATVRVRRYKAFRWQAFPFGILRKFTRVVILHFVSNVIGLHLDCADWQNRRWTAE